MNMISTQCAPLKKIEIEIEIEKNTSWSPLQNIIHENVMDDIFVTCTVPVCTVQMSMNSQQLQDFVVSVWTCF